MPDNDDDRVEYWDARDVWAGDTVVILGGGPSLEGARGLLAAANDSAAHVIAINDAFRLAPWADLLYFADRAWWDGHYGRSGDVGKVVVGQVATCSDADVPLRLRNTGIEGFDPRAGCIRTGNNSGYQALHLAIQAGAKRIILAGFDMRVSGDAHHWGDRPESVQAVDFQRTLTEQMLPLFGGLCAAIRERGIQVLNVSPGSALRLWPVIEHSEAIRILQAGRV